MAKKYKNDDNLLDELRGWYRDLMDWMREDEEEARKDAVD
jgi:hypothetical protein